MDVNLEGLDFRSFQFVAVVTTATPSIRSTVPEEVVVAGVLAPNSLDNGAGKVTIK